METQEARTFLRFYEQRNDISARWGCCLAPYDEVMKGGGGVSTSDGGEEDVLVTID